MLLLTSFDEEESLIAALAAGASGFLLKDAAPQAMVEAIRAVQQGTTVVSPAPISRLMRAQVATAAPAVRVPPPHLALSPRDLDVLRLLCQALSNAEIAAELSLTESTVKSYVSTLMAKLGVTSRLKAVLRAHEWGLVERED